MQSATSEQRKLLPMQKKQVITARQQLKITTKEQITLIYFGAKQWYESPKITLELQYLGYKVSRPESFARTGESITVAKYNSYTVLCNWAVFLFCYNIFRPFHFYQSFLDTVFFMLWIFIFVNFSQAF